MSIAAHTPTGIAALVHYLEMRADNPLSGLGDSVHGIHAGTKWAAEIKLSDLYAVANAHDAMLAALKASAGYLLNAAIDLRTGAPKKTALATVEGGLKLVRDAIAKAEGRS